MKKINHLLFCFIAFILFVLQLSAQPTTWQAKGIGGGGSLFAPQVSPHQNNEVYIVCDMTEMFHTNDGGQNWNPLYFNDFRGVTTASMQFTSDPNILYSISMDDFRLEQNIPVKSIDGGNTWLPIADPTFGGAYYIFADPDDTERVLVSSYSVLYFSNNGGASFNLVFDNNGHAISDLLIGGAFWDGTNIFVGTQAGLVVSVDNGQNFQLDNTVGLPQDFGLLSFAGATENGTTRLMAVARHQGNMWPGMIHGTEYWDNNTDVYRLDWGNGNWQTANTGIPSNAFPVFIGMSKADINTVYVSGAAQNPSIDPMVYKSENGGNNWTNIFQTSNNQNIETGWMGHSGDLEWYWAEAPMGFSVCSNNPNVAIMTDFGFAHITYDGGQNWEQMYVKSSDANAAGMLTPNDKAYQSNGLENTSSWWIHWSDADNMFAGYSDITGIRSTNGGEKWSYDYTGNTYNSTYCIVEHPTTGTLYAAVSSTHDIYQSTYLTDSRLDNGNGAILYSTDEGATWQVLQEFLNPDNSSNTVIYLALDPNDSNTMYASVIHSQNGGVFKTTDLQNGTSATWTATATPPRTEGHPFNVQVLNDGAVIATYSGRRTGSGFTASSGIFYSDNGGTTWQDRSDNGMLYWTKDLLVDPNNTNQNTWYVGVFSGWGGAGNTAGGVYKTTDRGLSWSRMLDLYRVNSMSIHPNDPDIMYVTTEDEGLWYSENLTTGAPTFSILDNYLFQHPMRVFFNPNETDEVWVTSFGNGLKMGTTMVLAIDELQILDVHAMHDYIQLEWQLQQQHNIKTIEIERQVEQQNFQKIQSFDMESSAHSFEKIVYKDRQVVPNTTYYYRLKSIKNDGQISYSSIHSAKLKTDSSMAQLYPNPVSKFVTIDLKNRQYADEAWLVNSGGQVVKTFFLNQPLTTIDLIHFEKGQYQLVLKKENQAVEVLGFIKN